MVDTARRIRQLLAGQRDPVHVRQHWDQASDEKSIPIPRLPVGDHPEQLMTRMSVTAFRDYLACPYRFFLRHVLKLRPLDDAATELAANQFGDLDQHGTSGALQRDRQIEILGELARIMTDAGLLFITTLTDIDEFDLNKLRRLNEPNDVFVVSLGDPALGSSLIDVRLDPNPEIEPAVDRVVEGLTSQQVFMDFSI